MLVILILFIALAIFTPFLGADSRDGLDRAPDHFWLPRRAPRDGRRRAAREGVRTPGSLVPASSALCAADGRRTVRAAG
jgi:hypothetical protein